MMSSRKLKSVQLALQDKEAEKALFESSKSPLYHKVDNKQLMSTAATVHWIMPFCSALRLVELFGSVLLGEHDFVFDYGDDGEREKFLRNRKLR